MSIQYGTSTPISISPTPPIDRDRWLVRNVQMQLGKNAVNVLLISALADGNTFKDRRELRMSLSWQDVADFPVSASTTLGQALADMIESKAKARGLIPDEAMQL